MHRRLTHSLFAAAAAASAVIGLGLTGVVTASAAAGPTVAFTTRFDTAFAGYVTGGAFKFRFVDTNIPVAACQSTADNNAVAMIALTSNVAGEVAHIDMHCNGGPDSITFGTQTHAQGAFRLSPSVGDVVRISVFRNAAACRDEFTAINTRTGRSQMVSISTPCNVIYRHAVLGATLVNPAGVVPPPSKVRLWVFRDSDVTSTNPTIHGTICGPWPADRFIATTTGTIAGKVLLFPTLPSNNCHNFGVWLNGAS
jgi:hypothetical protein